MRLLAYKIKKYIHFGKFLRFGLLYIFLTSAFEAKQSNTSLSSILSLENHCRGPFLLGILKWLDYMIPLTKEIGLMGIAFSVSYMNFTDITEFWLVFHLGFWFQHPFFFLDRKEKKTVLVVVTTPVYLVNALMTIFAIILAKFINSEWKQNVNLTSSHHFPISLFFFFCLSAFENESWDIQTQRQSAEH